jgi:DNA-binding NtrC family response regulator
VKKARVLVVEDDVRARESLEALLGDEQYEVEVAADGRQALDRLATTAFDAVLLDVRMPGKDGLSVLADMHKSRKRPAILVMTAFGSSEVAIEAMKLGAYDYMTKPIHFDELLVQLDRSIASRRLQIANVRENSDDANLTDVALIGNSVAMRHVYKLIGQVVTSDSTVLILGESGTGKELIARAIHTHSHRSTGPMIAVNCAAIPDTLLEAELFGYEKGAFTGAHARRAGKFQAADGGTLFLDEIGDLSPAMQVKLLRVLQEHTIEPLGADRAIPLDVRIIAATNADLTGAIREGRFREDLFYRLNVVTIEAPPLRNRREDIPALAAHILRKLIVRRRLPSATFTQAGLEALQRRTRWPGNVRELEHVIERALILSHGSAIGPELLSVESSPETSDPFGDLPLEEGFHSLVRKLERALIMRALAQADDNKSRAAEILKINRRLLYDKLKELGI